LTPCRPIPILSFKKFSTRLLFPLLLLLALGCSSIYGRPTTPEGLKEAGTFQCGHKQPVPEEKEPGPTFTLTNSQLQTYFEDLMTGIEDQRSKGKEMLKEVALRYASQHGLRPDRIEWVEQGGDEWWLKVSTEQH
jgi:hypothetical protein